MLRPMSTAHSVSGRVLIIDDEPSLCRLLMRCLRQRHEVCAVSGGEEAIRLLLADPHYDVILCDVMMPVGAEEVYRTVTSIHPNLAERFVFLSGAAFAPEARAFLDGLPNLRIDKPFDVNELVHLVGELVEERSQSRT
ncbi:MAG: response regulator [Myxococcota bacterium]|nr:response regulator [Myxococcota bacterium]